jgi:hypothetical protein
VAYHSSSPGFAARHDDYPQIPQITPMQKHCIDLFDVCQMASFFGLIGVICAICG